MMKFKGGMLSWQKRYQNVYGNLLKSVMAHIPAVHLLAQYIVTIINSPK